MKGNFSNDDNPIVDACSGFKCKLYTDENSENIFDKMI